MGAIEARRLHDQAEEAARIAAVRAGAGVSPASRPIVEEVTSAFAETADEAMLAVNRRWPGLWRAVIDSARADGVRPGVRFVALLEAGLRAEGAGE